MSKIKNIDIGLKTAVSVLALLEASGISVDHLVHISNSREPQERKVLNLAAHFYEAFESSFPENRVPDIVIEKRVSSPSTPSRKKEKSLPKKSSTSSMEK